MRKAKTIGTLFTLSLCVMLTQAAVAQSSGQSTVSEMNENQVNSYFKSVWRFYANGYALIDDKMFLCRGWDRKFDSSRKIDSDNWLEKNKFSELKKSGKEEKEKRDKEELYAATLTPKSLKAGNWGYIRSMEVVAIEDGKVYVGNIGFIDEADLEKEMEKERKDIRKKVSRVENAKENKKTTSSNQSSEDKKKARERLDKRIDSEVEDYLEDMFKFRMKAVEDAKKESKTERFLLHGIPGQFRVGHVLRKNLRVGGGYHIAIVRSTKELGEDNTGNRNVSLRRRIRTSGEAQFAIVPVTTLKRGITQEQFEQMLEFSEITKAEFVERVRMAVKAQAGKINHVELAPPIQSWIEMERAKALERSKDEEESEPAKPETTTPEVVADKGDDAGKPAAGGGTQVATGSDDNATAKENEDRMADNEWRGFEEEEGESSGDEKAKPRKLRHPVLPVNDKKRDPPSYNY